MGLAAEKGPERFTYREYRTWDEEDRWELIDGVAYSMSPAPRTNHQFTSMELTFKLRSFLEGKPCRLFAAPFDILFPVTDDQDEDEVTTVVQPDLVVVCDPERLRPYGYWGAPSLVVEILSPSTSRKDLNEKFNLYQRAGVKEYWVVDPVGHWAQQYLLETEGRFGPQRLVVEAGRVTSPTLPGLEVDLEDLWSEV